MDFVFILVPLKSRINSSNSTSFNKEIPSDSKSLPSKITLYFDIKLILIFFSFLSFEIDFDNFFNVFSSPNLSLINRCNSFTSNYCNCPSP